MKPTHIVALFMALFSVSALGAVADLSNRGVGLIAKGEWPGYARGQTAGPVVAAAECCNIFVGLGKAGILIADITDPSRPR
ncbi:MAG: hypothetical protein ACYDC1_25495, partial [Limisphaerales bacterium]